MDNQGEHIRSLIKKKGFEVKEFAEMLGITEQGLHKILKKDNVHYSRLVQMAGLLDLPINELNTKQSVVEEPKSVYGNGKQDPIELVASSLKYVIETQKEFINQQKEFIDGQRDFIKSLLLTK